MFNGRRPRGVPNAFGKHTGCGMPVGRFSFSTGRSGLGPDAQCVELCRRECAPDVEAPGFPTLAVAPVFQAPGGNAVQVEQVGRVTLAILACGVTTVNAAVGNDAVRNDDTACGECGPKLVHDLCGSGASRQSLRSAQ